MHTSECLSTRTLAPKTDFSITTLEDLSDFVIAEMVSHLLLKDLCHFSRTSKRHHRIAEETLLLPLFNRYQTANTKTCLFPDGELTSNPSKKESLLSKFHTLQQSTDVICEILHTTKFSVLDENAFLRFLEETKYINLANCFLQTSKVAFRVGLKYVIIPVCTLEGAPPAIHQPEETHQDLLKEHLKQFSKSLKESRESHTDKEIQKIKKTLNFLKKVFDLFFDFNKQKAAITAKYIPEIGPESPTTHQKDPEKHDEYLYYKNLNRSLFELGKRISDLINDAEFSNILWILNIHLAPKELVKAMLVKESASLKEALQLYNIIYIPEMLLGKDHEHIAIKIEKFKATD